MATITQVKNRINQLNQASYQILCDALLSREGYSNIVCLGTKDGTQKTTSGTPDSYCSTPDGRYVFAEYTTQKSGLTVKIKDDIRKCLDVSYTHIAHSDIAEIIYCHTSSNIPPAVDAEFRQMCEGVGIKLTLIGIDSLAERLMRYPLIIKDHLSLAIDTEQIQIIEDFIKQYNANSLAATLNTAFLQRENEFSAIDTAYSSVGVVLLTGPSGTGKTRLALEYAKRHSQAESERVFVVHDRALSLYEDVIAYLEKPGKYFIVIDDANQLSGNNIGYIIDYVNKAADGYDVKVLITVRDYALKKVKGDISGVVCFEEVVVSPFSDDEIKTLMQDHYCIRNSAYLDRIAAIAEGNARIAMLAGKIACETDRLDSINDVSELYTDYYGKALYEAGVDSDNGLIITAGIMAFLNAIHMDYIDALQSILENAGLSTENFEENLRRLHSNEIVDICNDKGVRFSEQCLANFVLKYVFYDKKLVSLSTMIEACFKPYRERTVQAINTLLSVFRSREIRNFVESEIRLLWDKLERNNSPVFLEYVKAFYPVNPTKTLLILQTLIQETPAVEMAVDAIDTETGKNYKSVSDDILAILGGYSDTEELDSALDLFFQYYQKRPDLYTQFFHASTLCFSVKKDYYICGCDTQIKYLEKIAEYADGWRNPYVMVLYFDIAEEFLKPSFSVCESSRNDKGVILYNFVLHDTAEVRQYRGIIWDHLIEIASAGTYSKQISNILRKYGHSWADYSKEIISFDAKFICQLANMLFSADRLSDCLAAHSLQHILNISEYPTEELNVFLRSPKMELYQVLTGPEWDGEFDFETCEATRRQNVLSYLNSSDNKADAFRKILAVYAESISTISEYDYKLSDSINSSIRELANSKEIFIAIVHDILSIDCLGGIDIYFITQTLFSLFQPEAVLDMLSHSNEANKNYWFFSYYREFPKELVNEKELAGLYSFLADDSDKEITHSPYRDIEFFSKFLCVDNDVFSKGVRIILGKRDYSPFVVHIYLALQFNEHAILPDKLVRRFESDLPLLEQMYLFLEDYGQNYDCNGKFLYEICKVDSGFFLTYLNSVLDKSSYGRFDTVGQKLAAFYQNDVTEIFDTAVNEVIQKSKIPIMEASHLIKQLLIHCKPFEDYSEKRDKWIEHYIEENCGNITRMQCLFEALSELSMEWLQKYLPVFVSKNNDFEVFKNLPLIPMTCSWEGSAVPMYSSWISSIEQILPHFTGLPFLNHRNQIEEVIRNLRARITAEEISDIIRG